MKPFILAFIVILSSGMAMAQEVKLEKADIELLKRIEKMEKAAGIIKGALFFSGLTTALSGSIVELAFNVSQLDLAGLADGISNADKIKSCSISQVIEIHLLDDPASREFWEKLQKPYMDAC
jgi:hypothetical protein